MEDCKYRYDVDIYDQTCGCANIEKIIHSGRVTFDICQTCPYAEKPDHKVNSAFNIMQSNPDYNIDNYNNNGLQFVWCYWDRGAELDELRYSMRSVEKYYQGKADYFLIGDKPKHYDGNFVWKNRKQSNHKGFAKGLYDVLTKMKFLSECNMVNDEFIWMMDDVFFVNKISYDWLKIPKASRRVGGSTRNQWQKIKTRTKKRLNELGYPAWDYATHLPHYVEKHKLRYMFSKWDPDNKLFLWEVVYNNMFNKSEDFIPNHKLSLKRLSRTYSNKQLNKLTQKFSVFNLMGKGWDYKFRDWLIDKYSDRYSLESKTCPDPASFVKINPKPVEQHYLLIQSAYNDRHDSRHRLDLTKKTLYPSLKHQLNKNFQLIVCVSKNDPYLAERKSVFRDMNVNVKFIFKHPSLLPVTRKNIEREGDDWGLPSGVRISVTRCDDDDVIPIDFFKIGLKFAHQCQYKKAIHEWRNGYVLDYNNNLFIYNSKCNQFMTMITEDGDDPHRWAHRAFWQSIPVINICNSKGWLWLRHDSALSLSDDQYHFHTNLNKAGPVNKSRWAVDITNLFGGKIYV